MHSPLLMVPKVFFFFLVKLAKRALPTSICISIYLVSAASALCFTFVTYLSASIS